MLTLSQTGKLERPIPIVLYGSAYWNEIVNFEALVRHGMIDRANLDLITFVDAPGTALRLLQEKLPLGQGPATPAFAKSRKPSAGGGGSADG